VEFVVEDKCCILLVAWNYLPVTTLVRMAGLFGQPDTEKAL